MNNLAITFLLIFALISCSPSPRYNSTSKTKSKSSKSVKVPRKKVKPDKSKRVMNGTSSYYGKDFHGKLTANGEIYDMYGLSAAHKTLPLNTIIRVTNTSNEKSLILRVNDRGPYIAGRILDCSYGAALKLGFIETGITQVRIEVIEWGDDKYMHHD